MENIKIIEAALKQIVEDVENGDLTAIEELLKQINQVIFLKKKLKKQSIT